MSLRELYRLMELSGENKLKKAHEELNKKVMKAYGFRANSDTLKNLLDLNLELATKESKGDAIIGPGIPTRIKDLQSLFSKDCIKIEVD